MVFYANTFCFYFIAIAVMQKNCEYCGSLFTFQRNTRKYCSDNCKQMAYFSRNGFTPANGSVTKSVSTGFRGHANKFVTVKDVKHSLHNCLKNDKNHESNTANERELERIMEYAKCLIQNLLHLSGHQHVERDTFLELSATWSQFVRWRFFKRTELQFSHYSLMLELETKLNTLAKAHRQSDLIEISFSQELSDQLNDIVDEMEYIRNIKFNEIRF
jgi:hypothetical protein